MVNTFPNFKVSKDQLNVLFPFHLLINKELVIVSFGRSMEKLQGNCIHKKFSESFSLIRPIVAEINFSALSTLINKLVLIKLISGNNEGIMMKGQFSNFESREFLVFTGTPWFNTIESLRAAALLISDFPHHNTTVDLLHLIKSQEITNEDLKRSLETISEQKNTLKSGEEQILLALQKERELNQLRSNLVSFASHEFRTPLACIRSSIELMQINLNRPGTSILNTIKHQKNILAEVDQLSELIDKFLTAGKIEANTFTCKKESLDLYPIFLDIIENQVQIQEDQRSVTLIAETEHWPLMADPLLLKHIFKNLISNALKYSAGAEQPVVTILYTEENVKIRVKDFGEGIPCNQQGKIFQAFYRADTTHHIQGTGLGLFITRNFTELHGGSISFLSVPQAGTEFTVTLPLK